MSAEAVEAWLRSRRSAQVNGFSVRPMEHSMLKGTPLSIQRGQAAAFPLIADDGRRWILKKFHNARALRRDYLEAVGRLLPRENGFSCGTDRKVLASGDLHATPGRHYCPRLATWLDGCLLMPRIAGVDWACLADELRDGSVHLDKAQRITLCRALSQLISLLEAAGCSHRDLSSGNVFIDTGTWAIYLIDFDSLYHPSLTIPQATTCGTVGYTAPYTWRGGQPDAGATWRQRADRYSLGLLNVEFLTLDQGAVLTAEGGIFEQDELRARSGPGLSRIKSKLGAECPEAMPLFEATLNSQHFDDCPSPEDWQGFCDRVAGPPIKPPALADLEFVDEDYFERQLRRLRPPAPLWPAPQLIDMPTMDVMLPVSSVPIVPLPPDPWRS